jgi:serine/threonine-protein kinase
VFTWRGLRAQSAEVRSPLSTAVQQTAPDTEQGRALVPGEPVGEYVIVQRLGEGGFGAVYEATHPIIGKRAAVKVLYARYSSNVEMTSRFISEARAVNQIRHKNIVDIFSFGDLPDGRHYYVMELLEGAPLDAYIEQQGRLPIDEALPILHAIAKALGAAHDAGILHRDLKPENVFLEIDSEGVVHPKVLDFGMAKLLQSDNPEMHRTRSNAPIGSPRYMSPEQCRGAEVDHTTDIYAFGCIAYRLLTGSLPFDRGTALELLMAHVSAPAVPPSHRCPELGQGFDEPLLRMLEKHPEKRPQSLGLAYDSLRTAATAQGCAIDDSRVVLGEAFHQLVESRQAKEPVFTPSVPPVLPSAIRQATPGRSSQRKTVIFLGSVLAVTTLLGLTLARYLRQPTLPRTSSSVPLSLAPFLSPTSNVSVTIPTTTTIAATSTTVRITLRSQPSNAEAYLGSHRLGTAPGPFEVPRSETPLTITVRASGYSPAMITVRPERDTELQVTLTPKSRHTPIRKTPHDLEDPY